MAHTLKGVVRDLSGKGGHATRGRITEVSEESSSPVREKAEPIVAEKTSSAR